MRIADRYLAFCTEAGDRDGLRQQFAALAPSRTATSTETTSSTSTSSNPTSSTKAPATPARPTNLAQILDALRKLREGIVASKRRDDFACQVYLFNIRLGILSASFETYLPALLYLLRVIHPAHNLTSIELHEIVGYLVLDTACRRGQLAEAFAVRNGYRLRDAKVDGVLRALVSDNWVLWRRLRRSVDGHRAQIMAFAEPQLTSHTLKAFGRAYLSVSQEYLEAQTLASWAELQAGHGVGWELDGGKVIIRKIQPRK